MQIKICSAVYFNLYFYAEIYFCAICKIRGIQIYEITKKPKKMQENSIILPKKIYFWYNCIATFMLNFSVTNFGRDY